MSSMYQYPVDVFLQWFRHYSPNLSSKIQVADLREQNAGLGIGQSRSHVCLHFPCAETLAVATQDLEAEEEIFSLSRKDILCIENTDIASLSTRNSEDFNPWNDLILAIIYEDLKRDASKWAPYLDLLPDIQGPNQLNTLMFWSEQELGELQASAVRDKIGRDSAEHNFKTVIVPAIRRPDSPFATLPALQHCSDSDLIAKAHRAGSLIMAYGFDLEPESSSRRPDEDGYVSDEEDAMLPKGMIPMADLLNADADRNNARLFYEPDSVTMKTLTAVKAGEQLFNDYGSLPRSDLVRRYGYVTDRYRQYDVAEIPHTLVLDAVNASNVGDKIEWLEDHDLFDTAFDISWPLEDESLMPWQLRALLHVLSTDDTTSWKQLTRSDASSQPVPHPIEPSYAYRTYREILEARLKQYSTSVTADRQILRKLPSRDISRLSMAIQIRIGEKELLEAAIAKIDTLLAGLSAKNGSGRKHGLDQDDTPRKRNK